MAALTATVGAKTGSTGKSYPCEALSSWPSEASARPTVQGRASALFLFAALIVCIVVGLFEYWPGLRGKYYSDDYQFYFTPAQGGLFHYFFHRNPQNPYAYRPIEATFLLCVQRLCGQETLPIHLTQVLLHALMGWLIMVWMLKQGFSRLQGAFGALFMLVSQANVAAVISNDTFSQLACALSGYASLWLFHGLLVDESVKPLSLRASLCYLASLALFGISLLAKESGLAFLPISLTLIAYHTVRNWTGPGSLARGILLAAPFVLTVFLYFGLRSRLELSPAEFGPQRYQMHLGLNILGNLSLFAAQALVPMSSVEVFCAAKAGDYSMLAVAASGCAFACVLIACYGWRRRAWLYTVTLGTFAVLSVFPLTLLNRVSELYVYNAMPFVSVLLGCAAGWAVVSDCRGWTRAIASLFITLILLGQTSASRTKTESMALNGERSAQLIDSLQPYLANLPRNGQLLLLNPIGERPDYSIYIMNGFNVLACSQEYIKRTAGRGDVDLKIVQRLPADLEERTLVLTRREGRLVPYLRPE